MANTHNSSALEPNKTSKQAPEFQNEKHFGDAGNFYSYLFKLAAVSFISFSLFLVEYSIFDNEKSALVLFAILAVTEIAFLTSFNGKLIRSSDSGFMHDIFWAAMAPLLAIYAREGFTLSPAELSGSNIYLVTSFACAVCIFPIFSMRHELWGYIALPDVVRIGGAVLINVIVVTFVVFIINRHEGVARTVPMLHLLFLFAPLVGLRILYGVVRQRNDLVRPSGVSRAFDTGTVSAQTEHLLLVGVNRLADYYIHTIDEFGDGSVEVVGVLANQSEQCGCQIRSVPVVGMSDDLQNIIHDFDVRGVRIDRVILCCGWSDLHSTAQRALLELRRQRLLLVELMEDNTEALNRVLGFRRRNQNQQATLFDPVARQKNAEAGTASGESGKAEAADHAPLLSPYFRYKRAVDVVLASLMLIVTAPIMLLVGLLISATIGFPGVFWQKRPGLGGRFFRVYKFRTMLAPFDRSGMPLTAAQRTTRLCSLIRRSRLDELPQLYNILVGDMSLVGPRPLLPIDQPRDAPLRLLIRPGVTGWAQVNGGTDLTPQEKLALDLWYARHASLRLDIKIIWMSVLMVFRGDRKNDAAIGEAMSELTAFGTGTV